MPKSDALPNIMPQVRSSNLKGLTLYELYRRQEMNQQDMDLLAALSAKLDCPVAYSYWVEFDQLRKRLNRAIYLKRLKLWLQSLINRK